MNRKPFRLISNPLLLCILLLIHGNYSIFGQIGGKTAADGVFVLDNAEDMDTSASGVGRGWIPDFVPGISNPLQAIQLNSSGLNLRANQSAMGALRYSMATSNGYIDYSFGVPMPGVLGASTLPFPGNITSFTHLRFNIAVSGSLANQTQEVILETYPGPPYPSIRWDYQVVPGNSFQEITIDLRQPTYILNQNGISIEELLGKTRYMAFYFFGGREPSLKSFVIHIDDIQLVGFSEISDWSLY